MDFGSRIEQQYDTAANPYHNSLHAADVCQSINYILRQNCVTVRFTFLTFCLKNGHFFFRKFQFCYENYSELAGRFGSDGVVVCEYHSRRKPHRPYK